MLFFYGTIMNNTVVTCSDRIQTGDRETVELHFERAVFGGFHSARYVLPDRKWLFVVGYSGDEIRCFDAYIKKNEKLLWHWGCYTKLAIIPNEEGGYVVSYPELPGCITCVEALEDIDENAADAKRAWMDAAIEEGVFPFNVGGKE